MAFTRVFKHASVLHLPCLILGICSEIGTISDKVGVSVRILEKKVMRILNEYLNYPPDFSPISI